MISNHRASIRSKHVPPNWREKPCVYCGKKFLGRGSGWAPPFYCSARCASEAYNQRRRIARQKLYKPKVSKCAVCGTRFEHKLSTGRYCSTRCRVSAHRAALVDQP
jgi:hypothetical protein